MSVVPRKLLEKIQWAESHVTPFNTNAVAIGTTVAEATAFQTKTEAARDALTAADAARNASKNASQTLNTAIAALDIAAAGICKQVRVKAETTNNPGVYALASIPAPATPSPVGKPGKPFELAVELKSDGSIELSWKCNNPVGSQGTFYHVFRQLDVPSGEFDFVGAVGQKDFIDQTVPAGTAAVCYKIQAARTSAVGDEAQFLVKFGVSTGGATTVSVTQQPPSPKLAA